MWWSITLQTEIYCREVHGAAGYGKIHRRNMYSKIPRIQELPLLFALMPTFLSDEEFNEKYQQLKEYRAAGYPGHG